MELIAKGIKKSFGAGYVLNGADLTVKSGEICALLGENGAGKSTFMNILGGVFPADDGELLIDGKSAVFSSPAQSQAAGIAFIHQELDLINDLTVYENLFLSGFPKKGHFLDKKEMIRRSEALFAHFGIELDPCALVRNLDRSFQQMTAISRALLSEASLIIMDEPTSALTFSEIERLFGIMRSLKERGISMIFISHKLDEVKEICDSYAILRNGVTVSSGRVADATVSGIVADMVGHTVGQDKPRERSCMGETVLTLDKLSDGKSFFDISLSVKKGEILGVTGLLGDGRSELFRAVYGICGRKYTGTVTLNGKAVKPSNPSKALRQGIAYLPKNRQENAIVPDMSALDNDMNVTRRRWLKKGFIDTAREKRIFKEQVELFNIKLSGCHDKITALSGGNQQKLILSEWLLSEPSVLILDNPTQGVDIGAKEEIYTQIERLAGTGMAVIVLSAEPQEIMRVCDSCLVMFCGQIAGRLKKEEMTQQSIMRLAAGVGRNEGT